MTRRSSGPPWLRWALAAAMIALYLVSRYYPRQEEAPQPPLAPATSGKTFVEGTLARNVILRDRDGETVFRGDVDLKPSLERIEAGKRLDRFSNDGITFQNRERRLPQKPAGYYREWVHPTPEINGPGPQRIVSGADGDLWYTPDHYQRFFRIRSE